MKLLVRKSDYPKKINEMGHFLFLISTTANPMAAKATTDPIIP